MTMTRDEARRHVIAALTAHRTRDPEALRKVIAALEFDFEPFVVAMTSLASSLLELWCDAADGDPENVIRITALAIARAEEEDQ